MYQIRWPELSNRKQLLVDIVSAQHLRQINHHGPLAIKINTKDGRCTRVGLKIKQC